MISNAKSSGSKRNDLNHSAQYGLTLRGYFIFDKSPTSTFLRRSFGSTGRHGEDDLHDEEGEDEDDASGLENMDHKMVANILRGLADAAENWEHTEL